MKKLILFVLPILFIGCGGISFHKSHPYVIIAKQTDSTLPAANYPFRIIYPYDHYGVFYIWNAPDTVEGKLDRNGRTEIDIANFYKPRLVVGSTVFGFDEKIIQKGGIPFKFPYRKNDEQYEYHDETGAEAAEKNAENPG